MTPIPIDEYRDAMRDSICSVCVSFTDGGQDPNRCSHEDSGRCSLFAGLEGVVEAISAVDSGAMDAYTDALRQRVCATCNHQDARGVCDLRDSRSPVPTWCVLDAHFNLIVGVVEDLQKTR